MMSVVEQILDGDWVEPLARGHITSEKTTKDGNTQSDTKAGQLVTSLFIGCTLGGSCVSSINNVVSESFSNS